MRQRTHTLSPLKKSKEKHFQEVMQSIDSILLSPKSDGSCDHSDEHAHSTSDFNTDSNSSFDSEPGTNKKQPPLLITEHKRGISTSTRNNGKITLGSKNIKSGLNQTKKKKTPVVSNPIQPNWSNLVMTQDPGGLMQVASNKQLMAISEAVDNYYGVKQMEFIPSSEKTTGRKTGSKEHTAQRHKE